MKLTKSLGGATLGLAVIRPAAAAESAPPPAMSEAAKPSIVADLQYVL